MHVISKITHSFGPGSRYGGCVREDVWPSGSARGGHLGSQRLPGGAGAGWGMAGSQPCSEGVTTGSRAGWCQGCRVPRTPRRWLWRGAEAGCQGRPQERRRHREGRGRLQGRFAQLDCGRISKWAQGQGRLRKQEMCLGSRNLYQVK